MFQNIPQVKHVEFLCLIPSSELGYRQDFTARVLRRRTGCDGIEFDTQTSKPSRLDRSQEMTDPATIVKDGRTTWRELRKQVRR